MSLTFNDKFKTTNFTFFWFFSLFIKHTHTRSHTRYRVGLRLIDLLRRDSSSHQAACTTVTPAGTSKSPFNKKQPFTQWAEKPLKQRDNIRRHVSLTQYSLHHSCLNTAVLGGQHKVWRLGSAHRAARWGPRVPKDREEERDMKVKSFRVSSSSSDHRDVSVTTAHLQNVTRRYCGLMSKTIYDTRTRAFSFELKEQHVKQQFLEKTNKPGNPLLQLLQAQDYLSFGEFDFYNIWAKSEIILLCFFSVYSALSVEYMFTCTEYMYCKLYCRVQL